MYNSIAMLTTPDSSQHNRDDDDNFPVEGCYLGQQSTETHLEGITLCGCLLSSFY